MKLVFTNLLEHVFTFITAHLSIIKILNYSIYLLKVNVLCSVCVCYFQNPETILLPFSSLNFLLSFWIHSQQDLNVVKLAYNGLREKMASQIAYCNAPSEKRITAKVGPNCKNIKCIKAWNCILGCTWINVLCVVVFPYISLRLSDAHICFCTTEDCIAKLYRLLRGKKNKGKETKYSQIVWAAAEVKDALKLAFLLDSSPSALAWMGLGPFLWTEISVWLWGWPIVASWSWGTTLLLPEDQSQARWPSVMQKTMSLPLKPNRCVSLFAKD